MKYLVETTGPFMLMDRGQEVSAHRPSVVRTTNFIGHRISVGQLRLLGTITDEATDAEFEKFLQESQGDVPLAVESFLSAFGPEQVTAKGQDDDDSKPKRGRKAVKE